MAVVAIFVATIVSCAMLPHPAIPEANVPEAHLSANGAENELTLTFGSYDWSYTANGQRYARQLVQVGSQRLDASELAQLDLAGSTPVTARFDVTPITAYVRDAEGRVLLGQRSDTGKWALVCGIVEPGEFELLIGHSSRREDLKRATFTVV